MRYIKLLTRLGFLSLSLLILAVSFLAVPRVNATRENKCEPVADQCGTDNGTQTDWVCPDGYSPNAHNWEPKSCRKWICDFTWKGNCVVGHYDYKHKVETQVACQTDEPQFEGCEAEGQCPRGCGLEATEVADGKGGVITCEATAACLPEVIHRAPSSTEAPSCGSVAPVTVAINPHVIRNGSDATVNYFAPLSDNSHIYYRTSGNTAWEHAVRDIAVVGGFVSYTIHDLNPTGDYDFGIQLANSCAGGGIVSVVVDSFAPQTFMFSHWEVLK